MSVENYSSIGIQMLYLSLKAIFHHHESTEIQIMGVSHDAKLYLQTRDHLE